MSYYLVLPLFQAFLSLVLLVLVLKARSQDSSRYLFALYLGGLIAWGILIYLMRSSVTLDTAHFWEKLLLPLGLLISVIIYHFSVVFTGAHVKKWSILLGYIACLAAAIFSQVDLVVIDMQLKSYGYAPSPGSLFLPVALGSYAFVLAAIFHLWKYSRSAAFSEERTRSAYILSGMVLSMVGGMFDVLPLLGLSLYPGLIIGNILFCIITSIAILKYHLLGVQIIVRKSITYFLTSAGVSIPYLVVLFVFEQIIQVAVPVWVYVLLFITLAFILQPLWRAVQSLVDKIFYMSRYDFLQALDEFSHKTHPINDIQSISTSLVKLVARAFQASGVHLYLPSSEGEFSLISSSRGNASLSRFLDRNPVLDWLRTHRTVLRRSEISYISRLQSLSAEEMEGINNIKADLFVPVMDLGGEMVGVLVLGPKLNHQPYSDEDEQLILTVIHRLAVKLENARLFSLEANARKELQKQNDIKTEFLHSAAHELKTPLTAIISSSDMLIEKLSLAGDDLEKKLAGNINSSALAMNRRVSELLDFARVQIGTLEINKQPLDLNSMAQDVASRLSPLFLSRKQQLDIETQVIDAVRADKDKLEQVFINLLSNANKFSPNNSQIIIRTSQKNGVVLVEIQDSAPIIKDEDKIKLFTPYYRGEDIKLRLRTPGLGLGLAITKKIIEMHNGKIWIESKMGIGNIFAFSMDALL